MFEQVFQRRRHLNDPPRIHYESQRPPVLNVSFCGRLHLKSLDGSMRFFSSIIAKCFQTKLWGMLFDHCAVRCCSYGLVPTESDASVFVVV